jgi:hypothetical protein
VRRFMLVMPGAASFMYWPSGTGPGPGAWRSHEGAPRQDSIPLYERRRHSGRPRQARSKVIAAPTGGSVSVARGVNCVVRGRVTGPQYAITHTRALSYWPPPPKHADAS